MMEYPATALIHERTVHADALRNLREQRDAAHARLYTLEQKHAEEMEEA